VSHFKPKYLFKLLHYTKSEQVRKLYQFQHRHCHNSGTVIAVACAGNCEDISLKHVPRNLGVRTGSGTANSMWECRENFMVSLVKLINFGCCA